MAIASVAGVGKEHIEVSVTAGSAVVKAYVRYLQIDLDILKGDIPPGVIAAAYFSQLLGLPF